MTFYEYRMKQLPGPGGFSLDFKGKSAKLDNLPVTEQCMKWESEDSGVLKIPGLQTCQQHEMEAEVTCRQRAAVWAVTSNAVCEGPPTCFRTQVLPQSAQGTEPGAPGLSVWASAFQACFSSSLFYHTLSPFGKGRVCLVPLYVGIICLSFLIFIGAHN